MTQNPNPFVRGYWNLRVVRTLCICYGDGSPHVWRSIHTSQAHLSDNDLISSPCIVTSDFALIKSGTDAISDELIAECDAVEGINGEGVVGAVVCHPWRRPDGRPVHVGDTYSAEAARDVVQRLSFETGYYSRCWEVSSAHICQETGQYLANLADLATPEAFLFIASGSVQPGDWRQADLHALDRQEPGICRGISAEQLRQEHRDKGMPDDLANILELAGQADVRILILDADAPALLGLPLAET